jgi:hypothetical protein
MVAAAGSAARHPARFLVGTAICSLASIMLIGQQALLGFPNSGDEYCYIYQAQTFAAFRLGNPPHRLQEFFATFHIGERQGLLVTSFPPGWPLMLAGAILAHVPIWIVNPLIGTATLVVLFALARRIWNDEVAVLTVVTVLVSSFFLFTSASYFAHAPATLLLTLFTLMAVTAIDHNRAAPGAIAGACLGWAVITRYYPALLCALPIAAGGLPFAMLLLAYNAAVTGDPLVLTRSGMEAEGRWFPANFIPRGIELGLSRLIQLFLWTPPAIVLAYFAALRHGFSDRRQRAVAWILAVLAVGLIPFIDGGGNQYGPRYYYEGFPFLAMTAVGGLLRDFQHTPPRNRRLFYLFVLSVFIAIPSIARHARTERRVVEERMDLYHQVEQRGVTDAVIFIQSRVGRER